jgi:hypothetical protein
MAECGLCRNCKWWNTRGFSPDGACQLTEHDGHDPDNPATKAWAASYWTDNGGYLITKPDFGCVQFSPKN